VIVLVDGGDVSPPSSLLAQRRPFANPDAVDLEGAGAIAIA
jgi:hypothetical protein